jgi:hypothetical protein
MNVGDLFPELILIGGTRYYTTSRKVAGSIPDEVDFSTDLILPVALWPCGRLSL